MYKIRFVFGAGVFSEIQYGNKQKRDMAFSEMEEFERNNTKMVVSNDTIIFLKNVLYIEKV